jgi:uncharacterized protein YndB with AHSA1/START domain
MKILKWIGIVLAALIVLPLLTLFVMSHRANAGKMHTSTEIAGTREQIWPWLDEGPRLKQWVSWLVEVREKQSGQHTVGSARTWVMKDENNGGMLMTLDGTFKEYAPPSLLVVSLAAPVYQFDGEQAYRLTDLGGGRTRLEIDSVYHFANWFAALMEPLVTPSAKKKMVGDLARLKALVESHAEAQ